MAEYQRTAGQNKTTNAIAETFGDSPHRELNRYYKTMLMFLAARHPYREVALDKLPKAFYARFAETDQATATLFLEEVDKQIRKEAAAFFRAGLYRQPSLPTGEPKPAA